MENLTWQNYDEMTNLELLTEQEMQDASGGGCHCAYKSAERIIACHIEKAIVKKLISDAEKRAGRGNWR